MIKSASRIDGFSLENILQIFSMEKKSQTLLVRHGDQEGFIDVDDGELINAEFDGKRGAETAIEILSWDDVQVDILPFRQAEVSISTSLISILMEASKYKDELLNKKIESGEYILSAAIDKAEKHLVKEAYNDLVEYIKINRNNAIGWLWYSRIQNKVRVMEKALKMARALAPEDALVQEEWKKFETASHSLSGDVARKCYFCWAPLDKQETVCSYCHGFLTVDSKALAEGNVADPRCLEQARERYLRILKQSPRNIVATYCMALIHVNENNFQEALGYLDKASKMAPAKEFFASQLKLLLNHLAHQSSVETGSTENQSTDDAASPAVFQSDRKLILVVEDSATTRKVISITLNRNGYRVVEAGDGLEALSKISEESPDLVMLDVILPKMDGYKILSIIKGNKEFKDIPVIMLTSKDGFINKVKGRIAGSSAYLTKPFDPEKMINEIKKHI